MYVATQHSSLLLLRQARDDLGNKRLTGGDEFVGELRGPSTVYATVGDGGDGTYAGTLNTTASGDHLLHVTIGMSKNLYSCTCCQKRANAFQTGLEQRCTFAI